MTPRNADDIINGRLAGMTREERDAYDAELAETRHALALADMLRGLREHSAPPRRLLARWLRLPRYRISRIEARGGDISLLWFTRTAHALGHRVTISVTPERPADPHHDDPEHDADGFVFVSSSRRAQAGKPPGSW